ncbi:MAG: cytochrome P450 [Anaerolineales bacterium]
MIADCPPGFKSYELLFQLNRIRRDTLGFLLDCAAKFGDLTYFEAGKQRAFLVNSADGVRRVLQDNHRAYNKDTIQYNSLAQITGRGLLTSDGDLWFRQRRLEQPAFSRARLNALDGVVVPAVQKMLQRWERYAASGEPVDVDGEMMRVTLEIVGKALFSIDLSTQAHQLTEAVLTVLDHIVYQAQNPVRLPEIFLTPRTVRFRAALSTLDMAVYEMIANRREQADPGEDMLGMLLKARDEQTGQPMSEEQVRDEVITLLIAGHETVASALTWSWYLLAQHSRVWENLRTEVGSVLQDRLPTTADLPNLPYTAQVFSEALRLYPPAWLITRKAIEDDQIGGYPIPRGALIIISPYVIHRHPAYWENPLAFDPERFNEARGKSYPRYAYIPFGGGPRLCIGSQFAQVEATLILAMVTQHYRLELPEGSQVKVDALVTLRPHGGLAMRVIRAA